MALEEARFADAERLLSEASDETAGLSREQLVSLLRDRALAKGALRDSSGARADFAALLSLEPSAQLGDEAAPSLRAVFDSARAASPGPLTVDAEVARTGGGFDVRARVSNDVGRLVRAIRVYEVGALGDWDAHEGERVVIPGEGELRYTIEAIGPGGAVVAALGTLDAPRVFRSEAIEAPGGGDDTALWVGIGVGAGLVVAAVTAALLAAFLPSGRTQPGAPLEVP